MTDLPNYPLPTFKPSVEPKSKKKGALKKAKNREKHERLLRLFDGDGYEEFHHPKYVFVKQRNNDNNTWQVAIYPIESWRKMTTPTAYQDQFNHLQSIMREE